MLVISVCCVCICIHMPYLHLHNLCIYNKTILISQGKVFEQDDESGIKYSMYIRICNTFTPQIKGVFSATNLM